MIESTIAARGQTTLPKAVREALSVGPGDRVRYVIQGDQVRVMGVGSISRLFGVLKHHGLPATLDDMDDAIVDGACSP